MVKAIDQFTSDVATLYNGDACEVLAGLPSESIDYAIFSPPFASLYTYSNSDRDLGNCRSREEFFEHYKFIAGELHRLLKPGRLLSFHCTNIPAMKERDGFIGIHDFRGDLIGAHCGRELAELYRAIATFRARADNAELDKNMARASKLRDAADVLEADLIAFPPPNNSMIFHSEVCIWKDPVTATQRTKAIGLLHKQVMKDSCMSRQGIADYLVTMRKPGINAEPVSGKFDRYIGAEGTGPRTMGTVCQACGGSKKVTSTMPDDFGEVYPCGTCTSADPETRFSIEVWQRYASPVWMDINPSDTLQRESAREDNDERHICPLQLQVINRGIELWTNPGDVVLSPFAGIGSEGYVAVTNGRRFVGVELKDSYYKQACANLVAAEDAGQGNLFNTADRDRCDRELAAAEQLLRDGHPDVEGLALAVADWSGEKRMIEEC